MSTHFKFVSFKEMTLEIVPEEGAWKQEESRKGKKRKRNVAEDLSTQKTINQEEGKRVIQEGQTVKSCALLTFLLCLFFFFWKICTFIIRERVSY